MKVLRVGTLSTIASIDPRDAADNISGMVLEQIFEPAYMLAAGETAVRPHLLEPLRSEGRLQYSAAVRNGARFSDGTAVTADIVARSLRSTKALVNKAIVDVHGDRVWFTLSAVNPRFDLTLTQSNCSIVLDRGTQLLGTGPFMFEHRPNLKLLQREPSIKLVRNPHHAQANALDELLFRVYPAESDGAPNRLVEALSHGEIDVTNSLTMAELTAHIIPGVAPSVQPGNSTGILFFNTERISLANATVRRAIALALDPNELAAASYDKNPVAFVAPTLLPPMMGRSTGLPATDREEARRLLASSNGSKPSRLSLLVPWAPRPYLPKPRPVATAIAKQLAAVGITIDIQQPATGEEFFNHLDRGNFDLALAGWIADTPDPADFFEALLWSKASDGDNRTNSSRWKNAPTDAALMQFREYPTEENKREIHRLVRDEAPLLPLIYGQSVVVHSRKVRNVSASATGVLSLATVTIT
ncbi:MAG TPA: ABC transporter substrate-binding protein [Thermoanaerobaculia bacterium]|nr:ABC transporter substrate-binding protein [Thermoanaerobaculia bacterium]